MDFFSEERVVAYVDIHTLHINRMAITAVIIRQVQSGGLGGMHGLLPAPAVTGLPCRDTRRDAD